MLVKFDNKTIAKTNHPKKSRDVDGNTRLGKEKLDELDKDMMHYLSKTTGYRANMLASYMAISTTLATNVLMRLERAGKVYRWTRPLHLNSHKNIALWTRVR